MTRIRYALIFLLSIAAVPLHATLRTWPGASPCDTTLNACLAASAAGDTVQAQSNGPIDEELTFTKPLTLEHAPGYRPVLAAGRSIKPAIDAGVGVSGSVVVEGFSLLDGIVRIIVSSGNLTVTVRHVDVVTTTVPVGAYGAIVVANGGSGQLNYEIAENRSRLYTGSLISGIFVDQGAQAGTIHDNRISANATNADGGVVVRTNAAGSSTLIYANHMSGNIAGGVDLILTSDFSATIADNAINCFGGGNDTAGMRPVAYSGAFTAQIFNNTIVGCHLGLSLSAFNTAMLSGRLANNLIANNASSGLAINAMNSTLTNDHNLVFGNGSNNYTPGPGTITTDPLLSRGAFDPRLTMGSPAIGAADSAALHTVLTNLSIPEIDADGLRRFKGATGVADIGAFEYGDAALIASATAVNAGAIDNPLLNGSSGALPQLVQDQSPDTYTAPAFDAGFTALTYVSTHFSVVDESDGSAPSAQSAYNVFVPGEGDGVFEHVSGPANNIGQTTQIQDPYTVGFGERIVLATHRSPPLFNHPFGIVYFGFWFIQQLDGGPGFPDGLSFAIYAQDPSINAFVWTAPAAGASTAIDRVLLNGEPCARLYVANGNLNPHPIEVKYVAKRWTIVNVDGGMMPLDAKFNVVMDEAATDFCRYDHIFHDGVEGS